MVHFLKSLLVVPFLIFLSLSINAQSVNWGLQAGIILSDAVHNSPLPNYRDNGKFESRTGFGVAGFVDIPLNFLWSISAEPGYMKYSYRDKWLGLPPAGEFVIDKDFHYLSLPVFINYSVFGSFTLQVGPQLNYLLDFKATQPYALTKKSYNSLDFSANAGINYMFTSLLEVGLRYNRSITPHFEASVTDAQGQFSGNHAKHYHRHWQAIVRFWLNN